MVFDPTINLGQLAVGLSFLVTIILSYSNVKNKISNFESSLDKFEGETKVWREKINKELEKQTDILITLGKQDQRLDEHERRLADVFRRMDAQLVLSTAQAGRDELRDRRDEIRDRTRG